MNRFDVFLAEAVWRVPLAILWLVGFASMFAASESQSKWASVLAGLFVLTHLGMLACLFMQ